MKYKILTLIIMITLHILTDFHLQGLFCNLKQKKWWADQLIDYDEEKKNLYKYDYLIGLVLHSFEWTFFFMIPVFLISDKTGYTIAAFIINTIIHAVVDDYKCNKCAINLIQDQSIHFLQILITWFIFFVF